MTDGGQTDNRQSSQLDPERAAHVQQQIRQAKRKLWLGLGVIVVLSIAIGAFFLFPSPTEEVNTNFQTGKEAREYAIDTCQDIVLARAGGNHEAVITECELYINVTCDDDSQCGPFPCIDNDCLILGCAQDSDCPNGLCGLHSTPVPGFCTTLDIQ